MKKDASLKFYKLFVLLFFALYMWGKAWDQRFREVVYVVVFLSIVAALATDAYQWWQIRKARIQELEKLTTTFNNDQSGTP